MSTCWFHFFPCSIIKIKHMNVIKVLVIKSIIMIASKDNQLSLAQYHAMTTASGRS